MLHSKDELSPVWKVDQTTSPVECKKNETDFVYAKMCVCTYLRNVK